MRCVDCGCTHDRACIGFDGEPCHWASADPPVCSTCADKRDLKAAAHQLRRDARELKASETVSGKWPEDRLHLRDEYRDLRSLASRLDKIRAKAGP